MSSAGCSSSTSLLEKDSLLRELPASGTYKVKYNPDQDWDFHLDTAQSPLDVELVLPHYRARNQPVDHRMSMIVCNDAGSLKVKVCRPSHRSKFYLEVQSESSDVTVWLPSDFRGQIHHSGRAKYSAGFVNRILQNVRLNESVYDDVMEEDEVVVYTHGTIAFRMWDTQTRAPENSRKENLKRLFGCGRKTPETAIDWDFLLD